MILTEDSVILDSQVVMSCVNNNAFLSENLERIVEDMCKAINSQNNVDYGDILDNIYREVKKPVDFKPLIDEMRRPLDIKPLYEYMNSFVDKVAISSDGSIQKVFDKIRERDIHFISQTSGIRTQDVQYIIDGSVQRVLDFIRETKSIDKSEIENLMKTFIEPRIKELEDNYKSISLSRSANKKGQDGEKSIYDSLSDMLPSRNGYIVNSVRGVKGHCDIEVCCTGFDKIYIDVKNYESGEKIRTDEVEKFNRDLIGLQSSGIMCSLWSGIVSKSNEFQIEQLPTGKFAIYLSNVNHNVHLVTEAIYLIHQLEKITKSDEEGHVRITSETLLNIRDIILDNIRKIENIKNHTKSILSILNEINISTINQLITNPVKVASIEPEVVEVEDKTCPRCKKEFSSKYKCKQHFEKGKCIPKTE